MGDTMGDDMGDGMPLHMGHSMPLDLFLFCSCSCSGSDPLGRCESSTPTRVRASLYAWSGGPRAKGPTGLARLAELR